MVVCCNGHPALSWPRLSRNFHRRQPPLCPAHLARRRFQPTVHSVPVRPTAPSKPLSDRSPEKIPEASDSSEEEDAPEPVLYEYATLTTPEKKEPKPAVLLNKPVASMVRPEEGSPYRGAEPEGSSEDESASKVMEDLGSLFSELGFAGGVKGAPRRSLSSAINEGVRDLKDGRVSRSDRAGTRMPRKDPSEPAVEGVTLKDRGPRVERPKEEVSKPVVPPTPKLKAPALAGPPPSMGTRQKPRKPAGSGTWGPRSAQTQDDPNPAPVAPRVPRVAHASGPTTAHPPARTPPVQAPRPPRKSPGPVVPGEQRPASLSAQKSVVAPKPEYARGKPSGHHSTDAVLEYFKAKRRTVSEDEASGDGLSVAAQKQNEGNVKSARYKQNNAQKQPGDANRGNRNKRHRKAFEGQFGGTSAQNRRKARQERQERRESRAVVQEREEIIEVGEEGLLVNDLAARLAVEPAEILKTLFMKGIMATVTQTLDMDTVKVVGLEFGVEVWDKNSAGVSDMARKTVDFLDDEESSQLIVRPPVVTVMGHVDHGKTSLLDYIRQTSVADGEAGGITQAIGAYTCEVTVDNEQKSICFLDTPGHEAFSAMRARGAKVTDMAIIIVAADDGIQPQTREAVDHARAADVPVVVAINKIDKEGANVEQTKQQLSNLDLIPEDWGGKTPVVPISSRTGEGIDDLLEVICLMAEMELELVANPERAAVGTVVEADLDRKTGPVSTLLVQNGTLRVGDLVVSGASFGKVRSLSNDKGDQESEVGPSVAVRMSGLNSVPVAGDSFEVVADESEARQKAEEGADRMRSTHLAEVSGGGSMVTLSSLASIDEDEEAIQRVNIVLKADTSGAIEAVKGALGKLPQDSVMLRFLHAATGSITKSDLSLASTADGFVLGYNIKPSDGIASIAKKTGVEIRSYDVIYDLLDDMRAAMEGRIKAVSTKIPIGSAEVKAVFGAGSRTVAGCVVADGRLEQGCMIQVFKRKKKKPIYEGKITSLRRVKEVVSIVEAGLECGVGSDFENWEEGDRIEAFTLVEKHLSLEEAHATAAVDLDELKEEISDSLEE